MTRRSLLAAIVPSAVLAQSVQRPKPVSLVLNADTELPSDTASLLPDGSLWLEDKCIIDEEGACKGSRSEFHRVLKNLAESCEIVGGDYGGPDPVAALTFPVLKSQP